MGKDYTFQDVLDKRGSEFAWIDISMEEYRSYLYVREQRIDRLTVKGPIAVSIQEDGGHLIVLASGRAIYVRCTWDAIEGRNKPGREDW